MAVALVAVGEQKRSMAKLVKLRSDQSSLPIAAFRQHIVAAVESQAVVIIAGDTGCGKPRRISAVALCRRVAFESLHEHGDHVAFRIRFDSSHTSATRCVFLTEGVLLRELLRDPLLHDYRVIIVDEVHERHVTTDLLLALLRQVVEKRPQLRLILMSATINLSSFSAYFPAAPIIQVPGRLYPIRIEHVAPEEGSSSNGDRWREDAERARASGSGSSGHSQRPRLERLEPAPYLRLLERIDQQYPADQRGDMLVFLPGMQEIEQVAQLLRPYATSTRRWIILLLHSALSVEDQDKVFDMPPGGVRKCILSTNIAETSVTIDGVRFVADSGRAKQMMHDTASGTNSLQETWISKAAAEQRAGRAGRTGPGVAFRLYPRTRYSLFPDFDVPEIQRVALESVVLQVKVLGVADVEAVGFLDPPPVGAVAKAVAKLSQHGALAPDYVSGGDRLTPVGEILASLPVDVPVGKMLILGSLFHLAAPVSVMAAALSVQSPFVRVPDTAEGEAIRSERRALTSAHGDPFSLLTLFAEWIRIKSGRSSSSRRCLLDRPARGLEEQRLFEMAKLQRQFGDLLFDSGLRAAASSTGAEGAEREMEREGLTRKRKSREGRRLTSSARERERERGRRVLALDADHANDEQSHSSASDDDNDEDEHNNGHSAHDPTNNRGGIEGEGRGARRAGPAEAAAAAGGGGGGGRGRRERTRTGEEEKEDYQTLELQMTLDVGRLASSVRQHVAQSDTNLLKFIIWEGLASQLASLSCWLNAAPLPQIRAPALPALLLTAHSIDCSPDARKLLVNDWLLLRITEIPEVAQNLLMVACELRDGVAALLEARLRATRKTRPIGLCGTDSEQVRGHLQAEPPRFVGPTQAELAELPSFARLIAQMQTEDQRPMSESHLARDVSNFMDSAVRFTVEPLRPPGVAMLFAHSTITAAAGVAGGEVEGAERDTSHEIVPMLKGGVQLAPYLRYGSLENREMTPGGQVGPLPHVRTHWECPSCGAQFLANLEEKDMHLEECVASFSNRGAGAFKGPAKDDFLRETGAARTSVAGAGAGAFNKIQREASRERSRPSSGSATAGAPPEQAEEQKQEAEELERVVDKASRRRYECPQCEGRTFLFTAPQILQHLRSHKP
eukprot:jgi/Mesen1/600/ME001074S10752